MLLETAIYLWFQRSAFVAGWGLDLLPSQCLFPSGRHEPVGSDVWSGVDHGRRHMPLTSAHPKIQTDQATDISSNAFELYLQCMPSTCSTFR